MQTHHLRKLSLAAATVITALITGCSGTANEQTVTPKPIAAPTAIAAMPPPAVSYAFYQASTEQDLKNDTKYGYLIAKARIGTKTQVFAEEGLKIVDQFSRGGFTYFHLQKDSDLLGTMERLKATAGLVFVEADTLVKQDAAITYSTPDPRAISEQYSLSITQLKDAWTTYGFGPNRPVVADLDTGINFSHEDLQGVVKHAFSWFDLDNGEKAIVPTVDYSVQPIDYVGSTTQTSTDKDGHGSHTAGTIAASGNNGKGVAGVCWNSDLVSYKVFGGATGSSSTWSIYGSLYHLINWKATNYPHTIAVNMSLGGAFASQFAIDMVQLGLENNVVIVASMGNSGSNLIQYPSGYAGVIAVGATTGSDKKVNFSTTGRNISVVAPGDNIISTYNGSSDHYFIDSGTSMSAPFVTGLVTYMLTFAPDLDAAQIRTYLEANTDLIEGATGFTERTGYGRVNVLKTIAAVVKDVEAKAVPATAYLNAPLTVHVDNSYLGGVVALGNVTTNLYACDKAGVISNYIASSLTVASTVNGDEGVAYFNLLKPGYYRVGTSYQGLPMMGKVFQVAAGFDIPAQTISYGLPIYNIATLRDAGTALDADGFPMTDTIIKVYNAAGSLIASVDVGALDTAQLVMTPGTYKIAITAYGGLYGEYALYVSPAVYPYAVAPGSFAAPVLLGSQSHASATPQAIFPMQLYNCNLTASPDYYTITIP